MTGLAIVTGGTRGIGRAISEALKEAGYIVVATYAANEEKALLFTAETGIKACKWDVADYKECEKNISKIEDEYKMPVSVLINNAGITRDGMLHKLSVEDWNEVITTNLSSCFNMCHACMNSMRNNQYGRIVNISSINGQSGQVGQTNYAAAKAGIIGFTKSLAKEAASKGITVNAVAPGYIKTEMTDCVPTDIMEGIISKIPIKRLGKPEEIATAVMFLVNKNSGFVTGETISVNGGHHMV
jgi:acetoacetyl-CoA reductase